MKTLANAADLDDIVARIRRLRPDSPRQWGRMSPGQMLCHCSDAFRAGLGEKQVPAVHRPFGSTLMKWFALRAPMVWPKNLPTGAQIDPHLEGSKPGEFSNDVAELEKLCSRFVLSKKSEARLPHPFFGPMSDAEWLRWGYLHQDHHLRQFGV